MTDPDTYSLSRRAFAASTHIVGTGADPGLLERGLICIKVWGFALLIFCYFFSKISHENEIIWSH